MSTATQILRNKLQQIHKENEEASSKSIREYLNRVLVDVAPEPKRFGLICEDWQRERNERVIPAVEFIAGLNPDYNGKMFFYEGFSKGSDKSNSIARIVLWMLVYAKRALRIVVAAKDSEQANVIYDAMKKTWELNPWLKKHIDPKRNRVESKTNGSRLDVLTSDAGGVAGIIPDCIITDELTCWVDRRFWDALFAAAMKRSGYDQKTGKVKSFCMVYCLTNAGIKGSWQWEIFQDSKVNPLWSHFNAEEKRTYASWLSKDVIESVRRGMSEAEGKRLLDNIWLSSDEGANKFFSSDDIDGCIGNPIFPPVGAKTWLGIDYGEKRDRTALSVVWMDNDGIVHVPQVDVYQGTPDKPVQLDAVEHWIELQSARFGRENTIPVFDEHQTLYLIQKYEKEGRQHRRFKFRSGTGNLLMADNIRTLMKNRRLNFSIFTGLVGNSTLADEFKEVIAKEKDYGTRISHTYKSHDDRVVAVCVAALHAVKEFTPAAAMQAVKQEKEVDLIEQYINLKRAESKGPQESIMDRFDRSHYARSGLFGV